MKKSKDKLVLSKLAKRCKKSIKPRYNLKSLSASNGLLRGANNRLKEEIIQLTLELNYYKRKEGIINDGKKRAREIIKRKYGTN